MGQGVQVPLQQAQSQCEGAIKRR